MKRLSDGAGSGGTGALLGKLVRKVLNPLGLEVTRYLSPSTLEGHLHRLLPNLGVNCVLDVGAHYGEYAGLLRRVRYRGRVVSFEPVPANYARLQDARSHDAEWRGMPFALGSEPATLPINVFAATDLSSLRAPTSNASAWFGRSGEIVRTESVTVRCLDDVLDACVEGIDAPRIYLKLDTQGFDLAVLQGATKALRFVVGMQAEIALRPLYEDVPLFPDNVRALLDLGFEVTGFFVVSHTPDWIAQIELDCVLRRTGT